VLRARHLFHLFGDLVAYTVSTRAWWVLPVVAGMLVLMALAAASGAAVPYAMYTLF
jgi:hypothetical protein